MMRLFFLTKNKGKLEEVKKILSKYNIEVKQLKKNRIEIQSEDLGEIALYSARQINKPNLPVIVEDAGLFIDRLNGFPGPYSSYVYKTIGCEGILKLMKGVRERDASFKSAVAYFEGGFSKVFYGEVRGIIAYEKRGSSGFGFDPIFIPEGYSKTFAELGIEEKSRISHRAKAFNALAKWLGKRKVNNNAKKG